MKGLSLLIFRHPNDNRRIIIPGYFKSAFFRSKQANFVEIYLLVEKQIILSRAGCVGQLTQIAANPTKVVVVVEFHFFLVPVCVLQIFVL